MVRIQAHPPWIAIINKTPMDTKAIKTRINTAIEIREKGNLKKSRTLFEDLIEDFADLQKEQLSKEFQLLYTTALAEYVIQYRLEAKELLSEALGLGEKLLNYDNKHKISNPLSLRSISNTLIDLQGYEKAIDFLGKTIPLHKNNSARRGDTRAHLAYCLLRSGQIGKAEKEIGKAIKEILENSSSEKYSTIKHSYALMVKALVLNTRGALPEALSKAKESLKVAESKNRVFRIKQAKELIDYLENKAK